MNSFNKFNCDDNNWSSTCTDSGGANNSVTRKTLNYREPLERRKKKLGPRLHTHTQRIIQKKKKRNMGRLVSHRCWILAAPAWLPSLPRSRLSHTHSHAGRNAERWTLNSHAGRNFIHIDDWMTMQFNTSTTNQKKINKKTKNKSLKNSSEENTVGDRY